MQGFHYMMRGPFYVNFIGKALPIEINNPGQVSIIIKKCTKKELEQFRQGWEKMYGKLGMFMAGATNFFEVKYSLKNGIDELDAFELLFRISVYICLQSALTHYDTKTSSSKLRGRSTINEVHDQMNFKKHDKNRKGVEVHRIGKKITNKWIKLIQEGIKFVGNNNFISEIKLLEKQYRYTYILVQKYTLKKSNKKRHLGV